MYNEIYFVLRQTYLIKINIYIYFFYYYNYKKLSFINFNYFLKMSQDETGKQLLITSGILDAYQCK